MKTRTITAALGALLALLVPAAHASVIGGGPVTGPITLDRSGAVSVAFHSSRAGARGSLYFLGAGRGGVITYALSSDGSDLGRRLFDNSRSNRGANVDLGAFSAGDELHFAYLITRGVRNAPTGSLFQTDIADDAAYFAHLETGLDIGLTADLQSFQRIGIEDIRDVRRSDFDFNDLVFDVAVAPGAVGVVPAPSAAVVFAGAALFALTARRRTMRA